MNKAINPLNIMIRDIYNRFIDFLFPDMIWLRIELN